MGCRRGFRCIATCPIGCCACGGRGRLARRQARLPERVRQILFVGYLAVFMFGYREGGAPWKIAANEFVNLQARWDAGWYLGVAIDG